MALSLLVTPRLLAAPTGLVAGPPADNFEIQTFAKGLSQPTDMVLLPDGRAVVVQRLGDVLVFDADGNPVRDPPAHIAVTSLATDPVHGNEQGLLGVVADPRFSTNKTLYFYASLGEDAERKNQVLKTTLADDGTLGALTPLLKDSEPGIRGPWNHNGGGLAIYGDQLYIGVGDTGHNKSPPNNRLATCLNSPNGKILRVNLDGSIPQDNPLVGLTSVSGCSDWDQPMTLAAPDQRIYAWGARNPFRFWIDPGTGVLWLGDVGENSREEVSLVRKGQHLGWPFVEGTKVFDRKFQDFQPEGACSGLTPATPCTPPLYDYGHENNRKCIIGGLIPVQGCQWPESFRSKYFFGDETSGEVFTLDVNADHSGLDPSAAGGATLFASMSGMSAFRMGFDNALYVVEVTAGAVQRIVPKGADNVQCPVEGAGGSSEPPSDPSGGGMGGATGAGGAAVPVQAGAGGSMGPAVGGAGSVGGSGTGTGPSAAARDAQPPSGCSCRSAGAARGSWLELLAVMGLVLSARRRLRVGFSALLLSCGNEAAVPAMLVQAREMPAQPPDAQPSPARPLCVIPASEREQPALLSQTGCVDPAQPELPGPELIAYEVNSPLWSDAAVKQRYFLVPQGQHIHVKDCARDPASCADLSAGGTAEDEGHWEFPVGSVLMKIFSIGSKRVETRLLMRSAGAWLAFSYEWNGLGAGEAQTDATLLPDGPTGKDVPLAEQVWHFPSRVECLQCHVREAGRTLGPSTQQLNRDVDYPEGRSNQLAALILRGLFDAPPAELPPYPEPLGAGSIEARARSYLHVNCSMCHRPGGSLGDIDLRLQTSFNDTALCNQPVVRGDPAPAVPQLRLVPRKPAASALSYRMHATDFSRMPKIGSSLVDQPATELIDTWIAELPAACPQ